MVFGVRVYSTSFFIDVWEHWAEETIMWATNDVQLFDGYEDGTFRPNEKITRAEFIVILNRAINLTKAVDLENEMNIDNSTMECIREYKDLDNSFWAYDEICSVFNNINNSNKNINLNDIFEGEYLNPNDAITREEAILLSSCFIGPPVFDKKLVFMDLNLNYKFYNQIQLIINNGIIKGDKGYIYLEKNITRAEAATLIQRLYNEMLINEKNYIYEIELLENIYDSKFDYFGDYLSKNSLYNTKQDRIYSKAINTLEYLKIIRTIPYSERELYDNNPLESIKTLKKDNYWNQLGVNYYLISYDEFVDDSERVVLLNEIVDMYLNRDDLNYQQSKILAEKILSEDKLDANLVLKFLEKWNQISITESERANILFYKTKLLIKNNMDYKKILSEYDLFESKNTIKKIENHLHFINNKAYLMTLNNQYSDTLEYLLISWEKCKKYRSYDASKKVVDEFFIGAIKKIKRNI